MHVKKWAVGLAVLFCASTLSVWSSLNTGNVQNDSKATKEAVSPFLGPQSEKANSVWPPAGVMELAKDKAAQSDALNDMGVRLEKTANGAQRLVVEKKGAFVHLAYREVASAGPDWAAIELRAGDNPPESDAAVWEYTDPVSLATTRGLAHFSLSSTRGDSDSPRAQTAARGEPSQQDKAPFLALAQAPIPGPRSVRNGRDCQSHQDGASGFVVLCAVKERISHVRAVRLTAAKPLTGAWVWEVPRASKLEHLRLVRFDLPLLPGRAEAGAFSFVQGGKGFVLRAEAAWAAETETPTLLFTEQSRAQPISPFFAWH
ncbi:MAG: hypothetical protein IPK82_18670 [Polyangiaceae bacterium]|nr:hypothetical protein [Polyangiaceae bacterium]